MNVPPVTQGTPLPTLDLRVRHGAPGVPPTSPNRHTAQNVLSAHTVLYSTRQYYTDGWYKTSHWRAAYANMMPMALACHGIGMPM